MGGLLKHCHDCEIASLCTFHLYTAVAISLPAQHFIKPMADLLDWWAHDDSTAIYQTHC